MRIRSASRLDPAGAPEADVARDAAPPACEPGPLGGSPADSPLVQPAMAAHAGALYTNVDPRNDRGNNTGDSQIEGLNQRQLDQNYWRDAQRPGGVPNPPYYAPR